MALTDVVFDTTSAAAARGNIGTVIDSDERVMTHTMFVTQPAVSDVESGVVYGPQNSQTGTLVGGGGGPTYYSFG